MDFPLYMEIILGMNTKSIFKLKTQLKNDISAIYQPLLQIPTDMFTKQYDPF